MCWQPYVQQKSGRAFLGRWLFTADCVPRNYCARKEILMITAVNAQTVFEGIYHREPVAVSFCPYRICPIGAHVDHQYGQITGLAIDKGVHIAYGPKKNGVVELSSLQFDRRAQWHIRQVDEKPTGDWADYLRGATWALAKHYDLHTGICGMPL